jgi:hypothetical protein
MSSPQMMMPYAWPGQGYALAGGMPMPMMGFFPPGQHMPGGMAPYSPSGMAPYSPSGMAPFSPSGMAPFSPSGMLAPASSIGYFPSQGMPVGCAGKSAPPFPP